MKGICPIWSRARHFSPSLPGDRYLKLGSKSDLRAEISGSIVGYEALAPRPEVLRLISCFYGNSVLWVFCLRNRKYPRISNGDRSNRASDFTFSNREFKINGATAATTPQNLHT